MDILVEYWLFFFHWMLPLGWARVGMYQHRAEKLMSYTRSTNRAALFNRLTERGGGSCHSEDFIDFLAFVQSTCDKRRSESDVFDTQYPAPSAHELIDVPMV